MDYFIDESGNSGDLVLTGEQLDFHDQPFFTLCALGVKNQPALLETLERLKQKHKVEGEEVKSTGLRKKLGFTLELLDALLDQDVPILIEAVDKKFMVCATIVNTMLLPPLEGLSEGSDEQFFRSLMADYLFDHAPKNIIFRYLQACSQPSADAVRAVAQLLAALGDTGNSNADAVSFAIRSHAREVLEDLATNLVNEPGGYAKYLPISDLSKNGKPVWVLPNLSSLTNLYARINLLHRRDLGGVRLVHDEQLQFDDILRSGKAAMEALRESASSVFTPNSDFNVEKPVPVHFASSATEGCLQVADVVAGFTMRFMRDWMAGKNPSPPALAAFKKLRNGVPSYGGTGINFVVASSVFDALG